MTIFAGLGGTFSEADVIKKKLNWSQVIEQGFVTQEKHERRVESMPSHMSAVIKCFSPNIDF